MEASSLAGGFDKLSAKLTDGRIAIAKADNNTESHNDLASEQVQGVYHQQSRLEYVLALAVYWYYGGRRGWRLIRGD